MAGTKRSLIETRFEDIIFASRWLQAPLYIGLCYGLILYMYKFLIELAHLYKHVQDDESTFMLKMLTLVDITMISNLIVMVIIGGYSTFVSKIRRNNQPDKPQWIDKMNAGVLKVKMGASLIGVSSIHLLQSFVSVANIFPATDLPMVSDRTIIWQIIIHIIFVVSTIALAYIDHLLYPEEHHGEKKNDEPVNEFETPTHIDEKLVSLNN